MTEDKFVWDSRNVLWHAKRTKVAGWIDYDFSKRYWYARTAGTVDNPVVRGEFDNEQSARDFLQFIANSENT